MPFVVMKMVPDPSDPIMRELIMRQGIGAEMMLFPQAETPKALNVATVEGAAGLELAEPPGAPAAAPSIPVTATPTPEPQVDPKISCIARITELYKTKVAGGVRDPKKPALSTLSDEQLAAIENHMKGLPDYKQPDI